MPREMNRRDFVNTSVTAVLSTSLIPLPRVRFTPSFDLIIKNGTILDGTGGPPWQADLGIVAHGFDSRKRHL